MDFGIEQGRIVCNEHTPFIGENRTGRIIFFSTHFELLTIESIETHLIMNRSRRLNELK